MKNLLNIAAFFLLMFLASCTKETTLPSTPADDKFYVMDWVTGSPIAIIGSPDQQLESRTMDYYWNHMSGATTKFGFQGNFYLHGTLINSTAWFWRDAGAVVSVYFIGDNTNEYNMVMNYKRKLPSVPCNLTIEWSSTCEGYSAPETFVIGSLGTTKSHLFLACE